MGIPSLEDLFLEEQYASLEGGILEGFGRLFTKDLRIYVYPYQDPATKILRKVDTAEVAPHVRNLYCHLVDGKKIKQLDDFDESALYVFSRDVLRRLKNEDESWIEMVPPEIAEAIKKHSFFGYRAPDASRVLGRSNAKN
jgi:hypothetical protein